MFILSHVRESSKLILNHKKYIAESSIFKKSSFQFSTVPWYKISNQYFKRNKYYNQKTILNNAFKLQEQKFKLYFSAISPQVVRKSQKVYIIVKNPINFYMTFLQNNSDHMGPQFAWSQRKTVTLNFLDVIKMSNLKPGNTIIVQKQYDQNSYLNGVTTTKKVIRELTISMQQNTNLVEIVFLIKSQGNSDDWNGKFELSYNSWLCLMSIAKKNIYSTSGMKTQIGIQQRHIVKQLSKRVSAKQTKQNPKIISEKAKQQRELDSDLYE